MDYENIDRDALVDIRDVKVDTSLPKEERIKEYVRQIKNPYRFKCGSFIISARFASDGVTLEERLQALFR